MSRFMLLLGLSLALAAPQAARAGTPDPAIKAQLDQLSFSTRRYTNRPAVELAKTLASYLFDDEDAMIRLDMSEFQERHSVARLIGARKPMW